MPRRRQQKMPQSRQLTEKTRRMRISLDRPDDAIVQLKIRIRESERREIEEAARRNHTSLNGEAAHRLVQYGERRVRDVIDAYQSTLSQLLNNQEEIRQQESLIRTVKKLTDHLQLLLDGKIIGGPDGPKSPAIKRDIDEGRAAIRLVEYAWNRRRPGNTSGAD
jgi:hypothetical protein